MRRSGGRSLAEIAATHATSRPVLVGTVSVEESESLVAEGVSCRVLNARNDAEEADIVAEAGALGPRPEVEEPEARARGAGGREETG